MGFVPELQFRDVLCLFFFSPRGILGTIARWHIVAPPVRCPAGAKFYLGQECNSEGKVCASYLTLRFRSVDQENRTLYMYIYIYMTFAEDFMDHDAPLKQVTWMANVQDCTVCSSCFE